MTLIHSHAQSYWRLFAAIRFIGINTGQPLGKLNDQSLGLLEEKSRIQRRTPPKAEVERRAKVDGISVNQFVATAVAKKLSAMNTAVFFAERRERADRTVFDGLMRRNGGEAPRPDDVIA